MLARAQWAKKKLQKKIALMKNPHLLSNSSSDDESDDGSPRAMDQTPGYLTASRGQRDMRPQDAMARFTASGGATPAGSARAAVRARRGVGAGGGADSPVGGGTLVGTPRKSKGVSWGETLSVKPFDKKKPVATKLQQREQIAERIKETLWHGGVRVSGVQYMMRLRRLKPVASGAAAAAAATKFDERHERIAQIERVATPKRAEQSSMMASSSGSKEEDGPRFEPSAVAAVESTTSRSPRRSGAVIDLYDPESTMELWIALQVADLEGRVAGSEDFAVGASTPGLFDRGPLSPTTSSRVVAAIEVVAGAHASERILRLAERPRAAGAGVAEVLVAVAAGSYS